LNPKAGYDPNRASLGFGRVNGPYGEIVIARPGCPHCIDYLERWEPADSTHHTAVISLAPPDDDLLQAIPDIATYTLNQDRRWYAEVPLTIHLEDGMVRLVSASASPKISTHAAQSTVTSSDAGIDRVQRAIWFDANGRADLGYIQTGFTHTLAYRLAVPSDQPLVIRRIHSECKCTVITEAPDQVAPRSEGVVVMRFIAADIPILRSV